MTVYINGRFLTQPMTGVERYAYNICKALADMGQPFTLVCPKAKFCSEYDVSNFRIVRFGFGNSHFWEQCVLPFFFVGKRNYIVLSLMGLGSIAIRNKVMTIHDLAFIKNPAWYSHAYGLYYRLMTPLAVKTSHHIITVSEFSKHEILKFYPFLGESDISVVYTALDDKFLHQPTFSDEPTERYALAVSSIDPRKNFARLLSAYKDISGIHLYIVGNYNRVFSKQEGLQIEGNNVQFLGRVSDDQLLDLYCHASCFIFPSIYEGFGLPPLEAMACGCPVLTSDIPVQHEVCGDAALYFNPFEPDNIRSVIQQYLSTTDILRKKMRESGYNNITRFSFEKSAQRLVEILGRYMNTTNKK